MLNLLIADDDVFFVKSIINDILEKHFNIKLIKVATNGQEVIDTLETSHVDVLLLDLCMPKLSGLEILDLIESKNIYPNLSIIVISGHSDMLCKLKNYKNLYYFLTKPSNDLLDKLNTLLSELILIKDPKYINKLILTELQTIGLNIKHNGTTFLLESISYIYNSCDLTLTNNLEKNVYPIVSQKYKTNCANVKSNIIKSIDYMYLMTDINKLKSYFLLHDDVKPTPKLIIQFILNKLSVA